ncbi:hypothetical protein KUH03_29240 [Sphingobacterium sp. E70]|uniref:hypothetical protein n=1 Tax=Sphingobacterium sp. E70 TaxID=2853439 RepID=UPI00211BA166|nr:hypothetical protein [Sphingobacterium sp. E70]ULT23266.1 hypothetical protein KUH03_29240 [Sphingobacterium sp. E70]
MQLKFNKLLVLLLTLCVNLVCAQQSEQHIDGVYKSSGAAFVINKNKTFLIIAYGTLIKVTGRSKMILFIYSLKILPLNFMSMRGKIRPSKVECVFVSWGPFEQCDFGRNVPG